MNIYGDVQRQGKYLPILITKTEVNNCFSVISLVDLITILVWQIVKKDSVTDIIYRWFFLICNCNC